MIKTIDNYLNSIYDRYCNIIDRIDTKTDRIMSTDIDTFSVPIILATFNVTSILALGSQAYRRLAKTPLNLNSFSTGIFAGFLFGPLYLASLMHWQKIMSAYRDTAIERIITASRIHPKNALIIESGDWSDGSNPGFLKNIGHISASHFRSSCLRLNIKKLAKSHSIQHLKVNSEFELNKKLSDLQDGTLDFIWFHGHGNSDGIILSKHFFFDKASTCIETLAKKFRKRSFCILSSCSTAKGENNIAKTLAHSWPGTTVHAPQENIGNREDFSTENFTPLFFHVHTEKPVKIQSYFVEPEKMSV